MERPAKVARPKVMAPIGQHFRRLTILFALFQMLPIVVCCPTMSCCVVALSLASTKPSGVTTATTIVTIARYRG
jgi:hypothetical protein